jgi:hypothetical protein
MKMKVQHPWTISRENEIRSRFVLESLAANLSRLSSKTDIAEPEKSIQKSELGVIISVYHRAQRSTSHHEYPSFYGIEMRKRYWDNRGVACNEDLMRRHSVC